MNIKINKDIFLDCVKNSCFILDQISLSPTLNILMLVYESDKLSFFCKSSKFIYFREINTQNNNQTSKTTVFLNPKNLLSILSKIPSKEIQFSLIETSIVRILGDNCVFNIPTLSPQNTGYQKIDLNEWTPINLEQKHLENIIKHQINFTDNESPNNTAINTINLYSTQDSISSLCTDGHYLIFFNYPITNTSKPFNLIIPNTTLQTLSTFILQNLNTQIYTNNLNILFTNNQDFFLTKTQEGTYPININKIPKNFSHSLEIQTKEIKTALNTLSAVASTQHPTTHLHIKDDKMLITCKSTDKGEGEVEIKTKNTNNINLSISINTHHINNILHCINNPTFSLRINQQTNFIFLETEGNQDFFSLITFK